jgi:hypothetical protein
VEAGIYVGQFTWSFEPFKALEVPKNPSVILCTVSCELPITVPGPQQPPGHLRDAIREFRDYSSDAVANRRVRDVWELARYLFTDTVCRALKINKPRPYDECRLVRERSPSRPKRHLSPTIERRTAAYEEEEAHRNGPSRHIPRRDLLLDEADRRELETLD